MRSILQKRWARGFLICSAICIALYLLRQPILRSMGNYLVSEDPLVKTQAIFVLGGNSYERGLEAAKVHQQFPDVPIIPTGGNIPLQLLALDTSVLEADLTKILLLKKGVPDSLVTPIARGTSTQEESDLILDYCIEHGMKSVTIISSNFHLRRVRSVFEEKFEDNGIAIHLHGAGSKDFGATNWWQNEEGLIITNNEYMKLVYYWVKY